MRAACSAPGSVPIGTAARASVNSSVDVPRFAAVFVSARGKTVRALGEVQRLHYLIDYPGHALAATARPVKRAHLHCDAGPALLPLSLSPPVIRLPWETYKKSSLFPFLSITLPLVHIAIL